MRIKAATGSKFRTYASPEGYINPERLRNGWFYSLVDQAVTAFNSSSPYSDVRLIVRYHGPAIQLDITRKGTGEVLLSTDLVPCIHIGVMTTSWQNLMQGAEVFVTPSCFGGSRFHLRKSYAATHGY